MLRLTNVGTEHRRDPYTPEEVQVIVQAYVEGGSYLGASLMEGAWWSYATVQRVVAFAIKQDMVSADIRRKPGRPRVDRIPIVQTLRMFPELTNEQVAHRIGVSPATVYRAKRERYERSIPTVPTPESLST